MQWMYAPMRASNVEWIHQSVILTRKVWAVHQPELCQVWLQWLEIQCCLAEVETCRVGIVNQWCSDRKRWLPLCRNQVSLSVPLSSWAGISFSTAQWLCSGVWTLLVFQPSWDIFFHAQCTLAHTFWTTKVLYCSNQDSMKVHVTAPIMGDVMLSRKSCRWSREWQKVFASIGVQAYMF